ncbi:MAG: hypothetical protein NUV75_05765 [Gallionella sp.]|nr:hypothetical protein [Gallionella sp.]
MTDNWRNWLDPIERGELAVLEDIINESWDIRRKRQVLRNRARQRRLRANG